MVRTKCCKGVKPRSIPGCAESTLMSGIVVYNSIRDEKELSRIKKEIKQM